MKQQKKNQMTEKVKMCVEERRQLRLLREVRLAQQRGETPAHVCQLAAQALEITKPLDVIPDCKEGRYTDTELELLLILIQYHYTGWEDPAKKELGLLKIIQYARLYFNAEKCENIEEKAWQILIADAQGPA